MIVQVKPKSVLLLESRDPWADIFKSKKERLKPPRKSHIFPIYVYRCIGIEDDRTNYIGKLGELAGKLQNSSLAHLKITQGLATTFSRAEIEAAEGIWAQFVKWESSAEKNCAGLYNITWHIKLNDDALIWTMKRNLPQIVKMFTCIEYKKNQTIINNFAISLILWINVYVGRLFPPGLHSDAVPKVIFWGPVRRNEVYFLIFLSLLGCDVLYLNSTGEKEFARIDPEHTYTKLIEYAQKIALTDVPVLNAVTLPNPALAETAAHAAPERASRAELRETTSGQSEKSFEDLAKLSDSVVMINVYNKDCIHFAGGSGVILDENGLIVTNQHVVEGGSIFGIVFENDDHEYITKTLVYENAQKDLALLRIDHKTSPIPLGNSDTLKRGQQIVAIGSPLGLMNTISDGIVAGFREFEDVRFIQVTAPISAGSSGGALLDRYGALVGITTSGYSKGQNLNLAIPGSEVATLLLAAGLRRN